MQAVGVLNSHLSGRYSATNAVRWSECRLSPAAALMSNPAAASHIVDGVGHYNSCFTLVSRGTCYCIQLPTDCLILVSLL